MHTVRQCLKTKGDAIWSIHPSASVYDALQLMADKDIGALLVIEGDKVLGIFSERDYARKVILHGKTSRETLVRDIMTSQVIFVNIDQSIEDCMGLITNKRIRHLPVLEGDKLAGVISIGDVVKEIIAEQEFVITQLGNYITGKR
jgi:CBS domain-containing protein